MASEPIKRTVLLVGKTGAGKSTIANQIAGKESFTISSSVKSGTKKCKAERVTKTGKNDRIYEINVLDTVGLFDTESEDPQKKNEEIVSDIKTLIKNEAKEGVNLVLFVLKLGRFTAEERETFEILKERFSDEMLKVAALVITCCDGKSQASRKAIVNDFSSADKTKDYADLMGKKIHPVGFPEFDETETDPDALDLMHLLKKKAEADKESLLSLVWEAEGLVLTEEITKGISEMQQIAKRRKSCNIL